MLKVVIDYSPGSLTQNETAVGNAFNAIQQAGGTDAFDPIAAVLFYQPDASTLGAIFDTLSGGWKQGKCVSPWGPRPARRSLAQARAADEAKSKFHRAAYRTTLRRILSRIAMASATTPGTNWATLTRSPIAPDTWPAGRSPLRMSPSR